MYTDHLSCCSVKEVHGVTAGEGGETEIRHEKVAHESDFDEKYEKEPSAVCQTRGG